ncbi:hypothetical protein ACO0QE_003400 [Hanseniaspora vineae]
MDDFLSDAGSKAFHMVVKSSVSFASSYALKKISKTIDDQINKTFEKVVDSVQMGSVDKKLGQKQPMNDILLKQDEENLEMIKDLRDTVNYKIDIVLHTLDLIQSLYERTAHEIYTAENGTSSSDLIVRSCNKMMEPLVDKMRLMGEHVENLDSTVVLKQYMKNFSSDIDSVMPYLTICLNVIQGSLSLNVPTLHTKTKNEPALQGRKISYSPSLLLNAANYVSELKQQGNASDSKGVQHMEFETTMYTLVSFSADAAKPIWKESVRRCIITLKNSSDLTNANSWYLQLEQSLDDGLYHNLDEELVAKEHQRQVSFDQVLKSYYNSNSHLLNIGDDVDGEDKRDVLVFKLGSKNDNTTDLTWLAFCKYIGDENVDDSDSDNSESDESEDDEKASEKKPASNDDDGDFQSIKDVEPRQRSIKLFQYVLGVLKHEALVPDDFDDKDEHLKMCLMGQYLSVPKSEVNLDKVTQKVKQLEIKD